jgi:sulfonate transport system substrate-binding protein
VRRVLQVYERARNYAIEHPEELKAALVRAARLDDAVAERQLRERTDITNPAIGTDHREAWLKSGLILQEIGVIKPDIDVEATVDALIDPSYLRQVAAN